MAADLQSEQSVQMMMFQMVECCGDFPMQSDLFLRSPFSSHSSPSPKTTGTTTMPGAVLSVQRIGGFVSRRSHVSTTLLG